MVGISLLLLGSASLGAPLRTLIIGGGPEPKFNQVAIESNVRYMGRILPPETTTRVLFADGNATSPTVQYLDEGNKEQYRAPNLFQLDGPIQKAKIFEEFNLLKDDMRKSPRTPVLLYFTGHGSGNAQSQFQNNMFDLWSGERFFVKDLADAIKDMPKSTPVALVMVQCYSGAFGNLMFDGGDPEGAPIDKNFCGFFASISQRTAAGCTPIIHEATYRDFTTYFMAALTGTNRLGEPVTGADYDRNGKVGMNEAFAYTLINDDSIDTPVCTSDVYLRRFVKTPDEEVVLTTYSSIEKWANPAQKAALAALSNSLELTSEDRLKIAYDNLLAMRQNSPRPKDVNTIRFVRLAKSIVLANTLMTTGERSLKNRYRDLIKAESANPMRP